MAIKDQTSLIADLLDPDLDTAEIARRHAVDAHELRAAVRSPAFRAAAAAVHEVDQTRTAALLPAHKARAVRRLATIAAQPAGTLAQAESARRAASALIRCKADPITPPNTAARPNEPKPKEPDPYDSRHAGGTASPAPSTHNNNPLPTQAPRINPRTRQPARPPSAAAQLLARAGAPSG